MSDSKLYIIDGSGYIFRAYHALPPLTRPDGTPVGAVYGFCSMLMRLLTVINDDKIVVVFDAVSSDKDLMQLINDQVTWIVLILVVIVQIIQFLCN